jgi:Predicted membrane protein
MLKEFKVKLTTKTMSFMAMFIALQIVLDYAEKFIPSMPQGGSISISLIAIFLSAYLMGVGYGVLVGFCSALLQFVLGLSTYYGIWSVVLDYLLPLSLCGLAPLVKSIRINERFEFHIGILFASFLRFISHFLSGAILFAEYAPEGQHPIMYSLWYNLPHVFASGMLCLVVFTILYPRLKQAFK